MINNLGLEPDLAASIKLISQDKLRELQAKDYHCMKIAKLLQEGKLQDRKPYFKQGNILYKVVPEGEKAYEVMVLPKALIGHVLMESHNNLGHNGIKRTYVLVRWLYYWKGMKNAVTKHIKTCRECQGRNRQVVKYASLHFDSAMFPMQFISMDLIGELYPPTKKGHCFALTVI